MPVVSFAEIIRRHVDGDLEAVPVEAASVGEALARVFEHHPRLRGYVLDDQGRVRKHVAVFVDGAPVADRERLTDPLSGSAEVFVLQALSGG